MALAAILLLGDSGRRREEAARARRQALRPSRHAKGVWMLTVVGKRSKKRLTPVSPRALAALQAHWRDLGLAFTDAGAGMPLFSPVVVPSIPSASVKPALARVRRELDAIDSNGELMGLELVDIEQFATTSPHAFQHRFGSIAIEKKIAS